MHTPAPRGVGLGRRGLIPCSALLTVALAGCATSRPDPQVEASIARSLGFSEAITFRMEGGPVDEPSADDTLTLVDAVGRAVMSDPALQAALARVRVAMADSDQARLLPNPVLDFVVRWGAGKAQIEVSLAQDLIQALQVHRRASAADNRLRQVAADAVTLSLDTVAEVQERYISAQTLESLLPVLLERRELIERLVAVAKARLEAQEGTRSDLTTLEAQRVELDVDIAEAQRLLEEERLRLARLIGEPSSPASWRLDAWSPPSLATSAEAAWINAALCNRPEIQSIEWAIAAFGDEAAIVQSLSWEGAGAGIEVQRDADWFAGPSVSSPVPVFDTGKARRARVAAERIESLHNLTLAKRMVIEEVRVALRTIDASTANLHRVQTELIPLQRQRRQQAEDAYRAGHTDVTALYLAEHDLRAAREREIAVERQLSVALVRLQRAVGGRGVVVSFDDAAPWPGELPTPIGAAPVSHAMNP